MIRKISLSVVAVSLLASVVSAEISFDKGNALNIREEIAAANVTVPEASQPVSADLGEKTQPEWTIMVYINGKNNLERYAIKDLNEMEMVGSTGKVNIVAELGRMDGYDTSNGDWKTTRRFLIQKDNDTSRITSPVLADLGSVDMGKDESVIDFGKWAKRAYPAKKYMMIIWNHGSGWEKGLNPGLAKGISYDEETGSHVNTPQLGRILRDIGGVDVYGSDACLMQMAEVDYEIKDSVKYIVGSEETEPGDGYTYDTFLGPVVANPAMTPEELGKAAVKAYADHYQVQNTGATQSLVKASSVARLLELSNAFTYAVTRSGDKALAKSARDGAVQFAIAENKDLYDFTRLVVEGTQSADVKAKGQALMSFITSDLVPVNRTINSPGGLWSGPVDYSPAKGIAVYLPSGLLGAGYLDLQWAKASNWDEFINWMNQP